MGSTQQPSSAVFRYVPSLLGFLFPGRFPTVSKLKFLSFPPGKETSSIQVHCQLPCVKGPVLVSLLEMCRTPQNTKGAFSFSAISSSQLTNPLLLGCPSLCGIRQPARASRNSLHRAWGESRTPKSYTRREPVTLLGCQHSKGCRGKKENSEYLLPRSVAYSIAVRV